MHVAVGHAAGWWQGKLLRGRRCMVKPGRGRLGDMGSVPSGGRFSGLADGFQILNRAGVGLSRWRGRKFLRRILGQIRLETLQLRGQLVQAVEFLADQLHLVSVQRPKHLHHHDHRLLELVEHLLLHLAEPKGVAADPADASA